MLRTFGKVLVLHQDAQVLSEWSTVAPAFGIDPLLCRTIKDALSAISSERFAALVTIGQIGTETCLPVVRAARSLKPMAQVVVLALDPPSIQTLFRQHEIPVEVWSAPISPSTLVARLIMSHSSFDDE